MKQTGAYEGDPPPRLVLTIYGTPPPPLYLGDTGEGEELRGDNLCTTPPPLQQAWSPATLS